MAWVDLLKQAEEVVRSKSLWKKYIDGTPLANDIAIWMASFAQEHVPPPAAQPQQEPVRWQPIETAPKDEIVLLGLPLIGNIREGDRRVYEGRWHEEQATWTSVNGFLLLGAATDWMPLPQPPIEAHGIKEGT